MPYSGRLGRVLAHAMGPLMPSSPKWRIATAKRTANAAPKAFNSIGIRPGSSPAGAAKRYRPATTWTEILRGGHGAASGTRCGTIIATATTAQSERGSKPA